MDHESTESFQQVSAAFLALADEIGAALLAHHTQITTQMDALREEVLDAVQTMDAAMQAMRLMMQELKASGAALEARVERLERDW
jgi:membrane protein required for beta-lactamase induction